MIYSLFVSDFTFRLHGSPHKIYLDKHNQKRIIHDVSCLFFRAFSYLLAAIPDFTDNNLINIIRYGEDYYASSEVNYMNQIDPMTLDVIGKVNSNLLK